MRDKRQKTLNQLSLVYCENGCNDNEREQWDGDFFLPHFDLIWYQPSERWKDSATTKKKLCIVLIYILDSASIHTHTHAEIYSMSGNSECKTKQKTNTNDFQTKSEALNINYNAISNNLKMSLLCRLCRSVSGFLRVRLLILHLHYHHFLYFIPKHFHFYNENFYVMRNFSRIVSTHVAITICCMRFVFVLTF